MSNIVNWVSQDVSLTSIVAPISNIFKFLLINCLRRGGKFELNKGLGKEGRIRGLGTFHIGNEHQSSIA